MGRKKKHPEHENLERWLVSYADFITLLFATFTALYAIATAELANFKDVAESISEGFKQQSILEGMNSVFKGEASAAEKANPIFKVETGRGDGVIGQHDSMTYMPGELRAMNELLEELVEAAGQSNKELAEGDYALLSNTPSTGTGQKGDTGNASGHSRETNPTGSQLGKGSADGSGFGNALQGEEAVQGIQISVQQRGIRISFDSTLLFRPGSADLEPKSLKSLDAIAKRLKEKVPDNLIYVEGHTDNQPINSQRYPSNWELSTARASAVVRRMVRQHDMRATRLVAVGYGDTRPIATNKTKEGRAKNRRIDIIVYNKQQALKADAGRQIRSEQAVMKAQVVNRDGSALVKSMSEGFPKFTSSVPSEEPAANPESKPLVAEKEPKAIKPKAKTAESKTETSEAPKEQASQPSNSSFVLTPEEMQAAIEKRKAYEAKLNNKQN